MQPPSLEYVPSLKTGMVCNRMKEKDEEKHAPKIEELLRIVAWQRKSLY
jgi:hypothetical protein